MRWRDIKGWEGHYQVSDTGLIRSVYRVVMRKNGNPLPRRPRIRKTPLTPAGYQSIRLNRDGKGESQTVHRIVAEAFIPNPDNLPVVRHLNDVKTDNRVENLAWGTWSDNEYDKVRNKKHHQTAKTKCSKGHPFSGDNLAIYHRKSGGVSRICKECSRESSRQSNQRLKGLEPPTHGTARAYGVYGCRCDECIAGMRERRLKWKSTE